MSAPTRPATWMNEPWNKLSLDQLLGQLVDRRTLRRRIEQARDEDLAGGEDVTSRLMIAENAQGAGRIVARHRGVLAGAALLPLIGEVYDQRLEVHEALADGASLNSGDTIATVRGPLRSMLTAERVMLNFLTHLSGIATETAKFVQAVRGTSAKIYDTRKTIPGLRALARYAVRCGGGFCHRTGLHDAVLVKDNHLRGIRADRLADALAEPIRAARNEEPAPAFVEVEVDTLEQLRAILPLEIDIALLDNMEPDELSRAVAMRDELNPVVALEASGGVNLETVRAVAEAGVDRIAIGAITHSAPALDIGLDIEA